MFLFISQKNLEKSVYPVNLYVNISHIPALQDAVFELNKISSLGIPRESRKMCVMYT